jgi:hypothetical protein
MLAHQKFVPSHQPDFGMCGEQFPQVLVAGIRRSHSRHAAFCSSFPRKRESIGFGLQARAKRIGSPLSRG